jgi:hypothetical protein
MALKLLALIAAWRLVALRLRRGRGALRRTHGAWRIFLALGALVGIGGAAVALEHLLNPESATEITGFALLSPAVLLVPVAAHLFWDLRTIR